MKKPMVIDLDEVDAMRLEIYAGIKNSLPEEEGKRLIEQAIGEWIETLDEDYDERLRSKSGKDA
jgi:hypothetical protein